MASPIESALRRAIADLSSLKARWALIGGFAIHSRGFNREQDVAGDLEKVISELGR
jgi:hypothetical protein